MTDTIKPEVGKRYVMRNGGVTGAMRETGILDYPFADECNSWTSAGLLWYSGKQDSRDLISEYIKAPAPAVDLTKNEKPFGLLDAETKKALMEWPHGWETYTCDGWEPFQAPSWIYDCVYRAKPAPVERKPRDWWLVVGLYGGVIEGVTSEIVAQVIAQRTPNASVVHVREVIE